MPLWRQQATKTPHSRGNQTLCYSQHVSYYAQPAVAAFLVWYGCGILRGYLLT